jgi:hypothetical protein
MPLLTNRTSRPTSHIICDDDAVLGGASPVTIAMRPAVSNQFCRSREVSGFRLFCFLKISNNSTRKCGPMQRMRSSISFAR